MSITLISVDELKRKAKAGDLEALQELRDRGFFQKKQLEGHEVSEAQRWILTLVQFKVGNVKACSVPQTVRLNGNLNIATFQESIKTLFNRHESLRTSFKHVSGEWRQIIHDDVNFQWKEIDLSGEPAPEDAVLEYAHCDASVPFDLSAGPPLRGALLKLSKEHHIFLFNIHPVVCDAISRNRLVHEMSMLYEAHAQKKEIPLPPLKLQYKDYAYWQNARLGGDELENHRRYWRRKLKNEVPYLDLPLDYPRPPVMNFVGKTELSTFDSDFTERLHALGRKYNADLLVLLITVVKVLLHRYTGQEEIMLGTPVPGRSHEALADQVGCFVNPLVLQSYLAGDDGFLNVLTNVKSTVEEGYAHDVYPFNCVVNDLTLKQNVSRSPVFDVMVYWHDPKFETLESGDIKISHFDTGLDWILCDLIFEFAETKNGQLQLKVKYNPALFRKEKIDNMIGHLEQLIESVLGHENTAIRDLEMLTRAEKKKLLIEFNDTAVSEPKSSNFLDLIDSWADKTPDSIAIGFRDTRLSYQQLREKTNRLAWHLFQNYQVEPGKTVGIFLDRSDQMMITLLAVLKAGGAYVPIDPEYPLERIQYILQDSGCSLLVSENKYMQDLASNGDFRVINIEDLLHLKTEGLFPKPPPNRLAYILYTSGSTGKPKGCQIDMNNLHHYISWAHRYYFANEEGGSFGLYSSLSFDLTVTSLFLPLMRGKMLHIFPQEMEISDILSESFCGDNPIDAIKLTPSHISLLQYLNVSSSKIQLAIIGGEILTMDQVNFLRKLKPEMGIYNEYGPTETTVGCIVKKIEPDEQQVLIGRPIDNTRVYILDPCMAPVPIGVPGEIYIGGRGVSQGYINLNELNMERFIEDPFLEGERIYKTGDSGLWLSDGNIHFLGRHDDQVKMLGYRIELGEIENCLLQCGAIKKALVVAHDLGKKTTELIAYLVSDEDLNVKELREHLKKMIPEYMIPAHFVQLDEMPLNHSGKVNRKALPHPVDAEIAAGTNYVAPRNSIEATLARIWGDVLEIKQPGVEDNFFESGGHSLKAILLVSKIQNEINMELGLRDLFHFPTIAELAEVLQHKIDQGG